jgi:hypothetical protein
MPHYYVKVMVEFAGDIHADNEKEAEDFAYANWSANSGDQISYFGVYSTDAEEIEADDYLDNCPDDSDCPDVEKWQSEHAEEAEEVR